MFPEVRVNGEKWKMFRALKDRRKGSAIERERPMKRKIEFEQLNGEEEILKVVHLYLIMTSDNAYKNSMANDNF